MSKQILTMTQLRQKADELLKYLETNLAKGDMTVKQAVLNEASHILGVERSLEIPERFK